MTAQELKNAILMRAVQGKLVPQDPNDEPASVLLEKIRAEKEQLMKDKKIKKEPISIIYKDPSDNQHYEKVGKEVKCIEDEIPFEIPEGWEWCRLKSICHDFKYGTSSKSTKTGKVIVLRMGNIQNGAIDYSNLMYTDDEKDIETYFLEKDDLLFNRTNSREWVGKTAIYKAEHPAIYAGYLIKVKPIKISPNYLNLVMNSPHERKYCHLVKSDGINQANVNAQKLGDFLVPIPTYDEQLRIFNKYLALLPYVTAYDKQYEKMEALNSTLHEALKKSILQYAMQGKLVPQNPDDEPASVLLERIRAEKEQMIKDGKIKRDKNESYIYRGSDNSYYETQNSENMCIDDIIPFEIPNSWCWCRLENISQLIHYGFTSSAQLVGNAKLLRITDIQDNQVDWNSVPFCSTTDRELDSYKLKNRDILIARTGGTIGKTYIVTNLKENAVFASYLIRVVPVNTISENYIKVFMESPEYWTQLKEKSMGTGQPNVNGNALKKLLIPIPPLTEQINIVQQMTQYLKMLG